MKVVIITALIGVVAAHSRVALAPPSSKNYEQEAVFLLTQGAQIAGTAYQPVLEAIQQNGTVGLWVCATNFLLSTPEPLLIESELQKCLSALNGIGLNKNIPVFVGGHSLGGIIIQDWLNGTDHTITSGDTTYQIVGQILYGSFIQRKYGYQQFNVPTLTLSGELDGLTRVTRVMESFYHQNLNQTKELKTQYPCIVIDGMNHFDTASGTPPALVASRDLHSELSYTQAHTEIAKRTNYFINSMLNNDSDDLLDEVEKTGVFFEPLIESFQLEGYDNFVEPCNLDNNAPGCIPGCLWTEMVSQPMMGNMTAFKDFTVNDTDQFHRVYHLPSVKLPEIFNTCSKPENCTLNTRSISQSTYSVQSYETDTAFFPLSAYEIRSKLSSRQKIYDFAGVENPNFDELDGPGVNNCGEINAFTYQYALARAGTRTIDRFNKYGQPFVIGPDKAVVGGPAWILGALNFQSETIDGKLVEVVTSVAQATPLNFTIQASAGFHYCKILSPARAMEWIYNDGLRANYGIEASIPSSVTFSDFFA